jgi:GT2 family glycosyltransferase/glycosyltransferase involved in cell wall biosynthesis
MIVSTLADTANYKVAQRWAALGEGKVGPGLLKVLRSRQTEFAPKYQLLNTLLSGENLSQFEFVVIVDDDIAICAHFLDKFLSLQTRFDLRLAQPARTANSHIDHGIVRRVEGALARQTLFVESGPVVSVHRSAFPILFPFDMASPMGWGYENVWAYRLSKHSLPMGIVDAYPVDHSLRAPATCYDRSQAQEAQQRLLSSQQHLPLAECYATLRVFEDSGSLPASSLIPRQHTAKSGSGVNVAGYFASEKGVGEAVRADIRALAASGIPYVLNNFTDPGSHNQETEISGFSTENPYPVNLIHVNADAMPAFVRRMGDCYLAGHYNIGFWAWELSQFPSCWNSSFEYLDEIWVPSHFVRAAIQRKTSLPVVTIPHCLTSAPMAQRKGRKEFDLPLGTFLFLFVFDFHSYSERKNPLGLIRAFKEAFTDRDDVLLLLKSSHGCGSELLTTLEHAARGARIRILDCVLPRRDMNALMSLADCYVSLHRSEGFGLTMAEAMAIGKPVIATEYSANLDFMTRENSFLVPSELVEIRQDVGPYSKGCVWAEPNLSEASRLMRYVFENRKVAEAVGQRAQADVLSQLNPKAIGEIIRNRLSEIAAAPTERENLRITPDESHHGKPLATAKAAFPVCSIVLPVHNHSALTCQCLDALAASPPSISAEVIVVDDGSTDGTSEALKSYGNKIRLVTCSANSGFAAACNEGALAASASEFLVFLNNDTIPQPGWLDALVRHARRHPNAAVVGSKLLFPDGSIQHAGVVICQDKRPRHIYTGFPADHPAVNRSRRFRAVTAACMLTRRAIFHEMGGFDSAFTNGYEDTDFCLRAGARGLEVHYCPESVLIHLQSATRWGRPEEEERNSTLYLSRWSDSTEQDDIHYYMQDNLLRFEYGRLYPLRATVAPRLAAVHAKDPDGAHQARDAALSTGHQCATVPLHLRVNDPQAQKSALYWTQANWNVPVPRRAPPTSRVSE